MGRFEEAHPDIGVRTIVVGSGEALELGRRGDVDVLIAHAPEAEARFIAGGYSTRREPLMSNDFVLVGPPDDPARAELTVHPARALAVIARAGGPFVSRGDSSGTHERELALWRSSGEEPTRPWYLETGQGQGTTLQIASERRAYALTDRATFDVLRDILELRVMVDDHPELINQYSVILPSNGSHVAEATRLVDWLTSETGQAAIGSFRLPGAAAPLFRPAHASTPAESGVP